MKNARATALLLAALGLAPSAHAQVFGQFTGAAVTAPGGHVFGAYVSASENVTAGLAQLRLSFYPNLDFGFHGGLARLDPGAAGSLTILRLGGDLRWQVNHTTLGSAADIALGGALAVETADNYKVVSIGPSVVASRGLSVGEAGGIVPYAGLGLLFSSRDTFGAEASDLSVPLRIGMEARLAPELRIVAELQFFIADHYGDDVGLSAGVNLPF